MSKFVHTGRERRLLHKAMLAYQEYVELMDALQDAVLGGSPDWEPDSDGETLPCFGSTFTDVLAGTTPEEMGADEWADDSLDRIKDRYEGASVRPNDDPETVRPFLPQRKSAVKRPVPRSKGGA